eukprot:COSAG04_NODE_28519_length_275_cov_0.590909_1_plen_60_part_01
MRRSAVTSIGCAIHPQSLPQLPLDDSLFATRGAIDSHLLPNQALDESERLPLVCVWPIRL